MKIGYIRVSKTDGSQLTDLQKDALLNFGVEPCHLYEDRASGKKDDRPGLKVCLKALRPGDTLVVWKLDRLGRDPMYGTKPEASSRIQFGRFLNIDCSVLVATYPNPI